MPTDANIHLRVPASLKARWVRASRAEGLRLSDWIIAHVESQMQHPSIYSSMPASAVRDLLIAEEADIAAVPKCPRGPGVFGVPTKEAMDARRAQIEAIQARTMQSIRELAEAGDRRAAGFLARMDDPEAAAAWRGRYDGDA